MNALILTVSLLVVSLGLLTQALGQRIPPAQGAALYDLGVLATPPIWKSPPSVCQSLVRSGALCDSSGNIATLYLDFRGLRGSIPSTLGRLVFLHDLDLSFNKLNGNVPESVGQMASLRYIHLGMNGLMGSIPSEVGLLTQLGVLSLFGNQLSGSIPGSMSSMVSLQDLGLSWNKLGGSIPSWIGLHTQLTSLDLGGNRLEGTIPPGISHLTHLRSLNLGGNRLQGSIPPGIGHLTYLRYLNLGSNRLSGSIPGSVGQMASLWDLALSVNQLSGSIPSEMGLLAQLTSLNLTSNRLSGSIPESMSKINSLENLSLRGNFFSGSISFFMGSMLILEVGSNYFTSADASLWFPAWTVPLNCLPKSTPGFLGVNTQRSASDCNAFCGAGVWDHPAPACGGLGRCAPSVDSGGRQRFACVDCVSPAVSAQNNATCALPYVRSFSYATSILASAPIKYAGAASFVSRYKFISITKSVPNVVARATYSQPILMTQLINGRCVAVPWTTTFSFLIHDGKFRAARSIAAAGFTFVVATNPSTVGAPGGNIGYGGADGFAFARSYAVEFDTFLDKALSDVSSNHVGLDLRGSPVSFAQKPADPIVLRSSRLTYAFIDYNGTSLSLYLSLTRKKPSTPILEAPVDQCDILGANAAAYVGFTAATGPIPEAHSITTWTFSSSPR